MLGFTIAGNDLDGMVFLTVQDNIYTIQIAPVSGLLVPSFPDETSLCCQQLFSLAPPMCKYLLLS